MQRHEGKEHREEESGTEKVRQAVKDVAEAVKSSFSETAKDLSQLYFEELQETYDAEHRIVAALETMSDQASHSELREAFDKHRHQSEDQIDRLNQIFDSHGRNKERATSKGIKGLIDEGTHAMNNTEKGPVRDAGMIAAAQAVEHYEMAKYGTLCAYAERLGFSEDVKHLKKTLEEEKKTDEKLTEMAEETINPQAAAQ